MVAITPVAMGNMACRQNMLIISMAIPTTQMPNALLRAVAIAYCHMVSATEAYARLLIA